MSDLISRQAAIKALYTEIIKRRLLDDVDDGMLDEFDTESILKALPSVELEKCRDCISRKAATDRFDLVQSDDKCMGYDDIIAFLSSLPSVEPERKPGKWISEQPWCLPKCSICGASSFGRHGFDAIKTSYCPNCGADMRGEENVDDK